MNRHEILEKVRAIVSQQLKVSIDDIHENSAFVTDLKADSLNLVELIMTIEESFNLKFSEDESIEIKTVRQAVEQIESRLRVETKA